MTNQVEFLSNLRRSLGRTAGSPPLIVGETTALSRDEGSVAMRAESIQKQAAADADALADQLEAAASQAGWKVARVPSTENAAAYIVRLVRDLEARSIVRSGEAVLERLDLERALAGTGVQIGVMAVREESEFASPDEQRRRLRQEAIAAEVGVTGVDYAIAETGSCVLLPRKGVSRVVSLLPPVHVAVIERGQVLPGLDELFALRRSASLEGDIGSYMNLVSGPSRSADIEYKLVTGVHGPGEVHMLLLG